MADLQPPPAAADSRPGLDLFLLSLRYKQGQLATLEANNPLLLDDPASCYVVYDGNVDVFAVLLRDGEQIAPRQHLLRSTDGGVVFCFAHSAESGVGILATGTPGTRILKLPCDRLAQMAADLENRDLVVDMVQRWVVSLQRATARGLPPKGALSLQSGQTVKLDTNQAATSNNAVLWVTAPAGSVQWSSRADVQPLAAGVVPVSQYAWLSATQPCELAAVDTTTWLQQDPGWAALAEFNKLGLELVTLNEQLDDTAERARLQTKAAEQEATVENALSRIAAVLDPKAPSPLAALDTQTDDPLLAACQMVGYALGTPIRAPKAESVDGADESEIHRIAKASGTRIRQVSFKGSWWDDDNGPVLASVEATGQPVALLPASPGRYTLNDPVARTSVPLTAQLAATLVPNGYTFYAPLPRHALTVWDLLSFAFRESRRDLYMVVALGIAGGLLSTIGPIVTGYVFNRVIPESNRAQLLLVGLVLLVIAGSSVLLQITRSIAMLRVEGKSGSALQAAVWDRLLRLPVRFFRDYSAGDLGVRVMGIDQIRQTLSGPVITSILTGIFSVFNIVLLFVYDASLAAVATGLVLIAMLATIAVGYVQVRQQRALSELQGRIQGVVLQFLNGIAKFKVAGAQSHAFAAWADLFSQQRRLSYRVRSTSNWLGVFNAAFPIITSVAIFASVGLSAGRLSTGTFLAFNAAFGQLLFAAIMLSGAVTSVLGVVPTYERARPILETLPEDSDDKADPGRLTGAIEVSHVAFRYAPDGPLVLKDVSFEAQPGEFVALVGPSGAGKSSLLRLLLGFDKPESGAVYFDDKDLQSLDMQSVRHQIGVVLQSGRIMPGLLLQNIIGSSLLTVDDAWEAARMAGLDADIRAMPMGMFTMISEGASTLSGGQRQRLMIARAVVNKPRIIFFDEATSALDNRTQEQVSRSLEGLQATRVVIAHRLSTIVNAHRIYVMDAGRIVQTGTYSELISQPGMFADLAKRQLA